MEREERDGKRRERLKEKREMEREERDGKSSKDIKPPPLYLLYIMKRGNKENVLAINVFI